jgi:nicotinamide-nucleotide amidase
VTRPRASIVVTGSELVRGERTDLNGPFLAREVMRLGLEPARIAIVGDGADELEGVLREAFASSDLCLTSGGLGPTHDDRTVEVVARVAGRPLVVDEELEGRIEEISRVIADRLRRPYADFADGVRKQATVPDGSHVLGPAGTAPGLVVDASPCVVVLPGPPGELRRLWPLALETEPVQAVFRRTKPSGRRSLRFYGASESAVAKALQEVGGDGDGVEATICARDFEIHVDLVYDAGAEQRADAVAEGLRGPLAKYLFAEDERTVQEIVLGLCRERGLTLGTAESCTGGLVAARLTDVPGSSDVFLGGIVAYSDGVKASELDVPAAVLERHGAVSAETAAAMAAGVRRRLGVDVGVAVTGIAGPGGATPGKPVGLVHFHASGPDGERPLQFELPGERDWIRSRSAAAALHLVRRLLERPAGGA